MKYEGRHSPFWEADCYLQKAQDVISRSLHELASITIKNDNKQSKFLRRHRQSFSSLHSSATIYRKNSFPAVCVSEHDIVNFLQSFSSSDDQTADAEYYLPSRRKRFTRRQRRNLTEVFGERTSKSTSALNKVNRSESTSSNDNDNINERRKRLVSTIEGYYAGVIERSRKINTCYDGSLQSSTLWKTRLTRTKKRDQSTALRRATKSTKAAFLSLRRNYPNSSLITRSTTEICYKSTSTQVSAPTEPADISRKFKGPSARKAHRRALRCKLNSFANNDEFERNAGSQTRLDIHVDNTQFKKDTPVRRSASVRDLNGTMIDFTNQDSVTRWTSQILAEIDSLPSSNFDLTGQPTLQSSSVIIPATSAATTVITDSDIVHCSEPDYDHLKQNSQSPTGNNSDISFKVDTMNSLLSAQSLTHYRMQKIASKSSLNHFIKFQERNSCKKNIWHQSTEIPEVSCTAHIVLTARPSNRRKQSAHAIVVSAPKAAERSEKLYFLSPKFNNNNRGPNSQNHNSLKNGSSSNESSRLWRFLSQKKYLSLKKYLKLHQKDTSITEVVSNTEVLGFSKENSSIVTNDKNHLFECNSEKLKWRIKEVESNHGLSVSRTNLSLVLDTKPDRHSSKMPKSAYGQLPDYTAANDVEWRSNIDSINKSNGRIGSRAYFSMESIDLVKKSDIDDRLKFLRETKQIQPVAETSSSLTVWKGRVGCVFLVFNYDKLSS